MNNFQKHLLSELRTADMYVKGLIHVLKKKDHPKTKEHLAKYHSIRKTITAPKLKVIQKLSDSIRESVFKDLEVNNIIPKSKIILYYFRLMNRLGEATGTYILLMEGLISKMRGYDWNCKSYRARHTKKIQVLYFNPDKNHVIKKHLFWYENPKNPIYSGLNVEEKMIKIFGPKSQQSVNWEYVPKGKLITIVDDRDNRFNEVLFKTLVRPELREILRTHPDFTSKFTGSCIMMRDEVDNPITDLHWLRDMFPYDNYLDVLL